MKNSIGLVFIHGAGLGSFIWQELKTKIGMPALTIDFPHRKDGYSLNNLTIKDYVNPIVRDIKSWDMQRIIIIAHSIGGIVGLKVAEEIKYQQLSGFIAMGASIPKQGDSFLSGMPFPKNIMTNLMLKFGGTKPPKSTIIRRLCNDLSPEQTQKVVNNFTAESKEIFFERVNMKIPDVKKMYIKLLRDSSFDISIQEKMAQNLHADKIISINAGHLAMLSEPEQLANTIKEFVKEIDKDYFNPINADFTPKVKKIKVKDI